MKIDTYTIALLLLRPDALAMPEETQSALQDAHMDHLASLHEHGELLAAGVQEGVQQGAVHWVLGQYRADDDLLAGDHELAVVPCHVALLVAHHPHVRVGDVRPRLGVVTVRPRRLITGAMPARLPGRRGRVPRLLLGPLRIAAGFRAGSPEATSTQPGYMTAAKDRK